MTLDDMMQLAEDQARRILLRTRAELIPQWVYVKGDGNVNIVATPWHNNHEKHLAVELMRKAMKLDQATAYSLLVEAWFKQIEGPEAQKPYTGPPPSELPDRKEAVVISAADREGNSLHRHFEIIRDHQARCIELKRMDWPEDRITSAVFDNLLADDRGRSN